MLMGRHASCRIPLRYPDPAALPNLDWTPRFLVFPNRLVVFHNPGPLAVVLAVVQQLADLVETTSLVQMLMQGKSTTCATLNQPRKRAGLSHHHHALAF
jgi:hypothetical protein